MGMKDSRLSGRGGGNLIEKKDSPPRPFAGVGRDTPSKGLQKILRTLLVFYSSRGFGRLLSGEAHQKDGVSIGLLGARTKLPRKGKEGELGNNGQCR